MAHPLVWSLSARRAWIEIYNLVDIDDKFSVALRKESVDRNLVVALLAVGRAGSLSARRAWIEIKNCTLVSYTAYCRSPQGERG